MKVVIAHSSKSATLRQAVVLGAMTITLLAIDLYATDWKEFREPYAHLGDLYFGIIGFLGAPFVAFLVGTLIWQGTFGKAIAIWINRGRLVYLHPYLFSVECADISEIVLGVYGNSSAPCILIRTRDR